LKPLNAEKHRLIIYLAYIHCGEFCTVTAYAQFSCCPLHRNFVIQFIITILFIIYDFISKYMIIVPQCVDLRPFVVAIPAGLMNTLPKPSPTGFITVHTSE